MLLADHVPLSVKLYAVGYGDAPDIPAKLFHLEDAPLAGTVLPVASPASTSGHWSIPYALIPLM